MRFVAGCRNSEQAVPQVLWQVFVRTEALAVNGVALADFDEFFQAFFGFETV